MDLNRQEWCRHVLVAHDALRAGYFADELALHGPPKDAFEPVVTHIRVDVALHLRPGAVPDGYTAFIVHGTAHRVS